MKHARVLLVAALTTPCLAALAPTVALAQDEPADGAGEAGEEVELEADPLPGVGGDAPSGSEENPGAPTTESGGAIDDSPAPRRTGYPLEEVLRPLTLPAAISEIALDAGTTFDPVTTTTLRARYGVTRQWQAGLRYNVGSFNDIGEADGKDKFHAGKAVSVEATYLAQDWVAVRLSLPMYMDPFAMGVGIGVPVKFHFGSKLAVFGLDDLLEVKIYDFVPSLTSESINQVLVTSSENNTERPDGTVRVHGGAIYQVKPDLAVSALTGYTFVDFSGDDAAIPLLVTVQKSLGASFDVAGRIGFGNLDLAEDTFGVQLTAAFRI